MAVKKTPAFLKMLLDTEKSDEMLMHLMSQDPSTLQKMMLDKKVEPHHRAQLLQKLSAANPELAVGLIEPILAAASNDESQAIAEKAQKLQEMLEAMQAGPLRYGHFISLIKTLGAVPRAQIKLHDGSTAFSPVPDSKMCKELKVGDGTMLDAQGRAVLYRDPTLPSTGQTARLDRVLEDGSLLV